MDNRTKARKVFGYYWNKARSYPALVAGVLFFLPLTVLINSYIPTLILASVLNRLSRHDYHSGDLLGSFGPELLAYLVALMAGLVLWRIVDIFAWRLEGAVEKDIAEEVLDRLLDESADFHANNFTGSLVSQNNKLMGGYIRTADTTIFNVFPLVSGIVIVTIILGLRVPLYAFVLLVVSVLFIYASFKVSNPVREKGAKMAAAESRQTGYLADAITNVIAVKSFARGKYERQRFTKATKSTYAHLMSLAVAHKRQMNYLGSLSRFMSGLALLMAVVSVIEFGVNIATVFLIFSYTAAIADQLFNFSNNSLRNYNRSIGDAVDMVEILERSPAVQDPAQPEKLKIKHGEVIFDRVSFDHDKAGQRKKKALFENFNLHIAPGQKIGLVGHSGGGKTTLTKLILRFMDVNGGQILIDGQNIAQISQDDLRRSIAYVPQEPLLFHRTLAENISYGKPSSSEVEIKRAAKLAHADDFIQGLPDGYDTLVGERGIKLSGGQRQRIAIARSILKNAPILVLDEATSALDSESEKLIQDALWKLMEGRTAIVIAHRLSTIQRMDKIVVLEDGQIAEQGSHKELLAAKGTYAQLWAHQSGGFIEE